MKRILALLLTTLFLSAASALTLPENARITLVSDTGIVLGVGELSGGNLELTLEVSASGFVTLVIEGADGEILSLDGLIDAEGRVLVLGAGDLEDLAGSVEAAGAEAQVAFVERIAGGLDNSGDLPEQAKAGIAVAVTNQSEAMARAAAGQSNAEAGSEAGAEADAEGSSDTGIDHSAGAEGSIETGVESSTDGIAKAETAIEADLSIGVDATVGIGRP